MNEPREQSILFWIKAHVPWAWLGLLGVALALRLFRLDFRSLWLDEAYSLVLASANLKGIILGASMDIHPPLFHLFLAGWIHVFGTSEFAARSLSAAFGTLLVGAVFLVVKEWVNRQTAWIVAWLVACSPYFIELSRSGRMAALLVLLCTLAAYFFWRFIAYGKVRDSVGYVAFTLAAFYTHYFALLPFAAQHMYVFMGIGKLGLSRETRKNWMSMQLVLCMGCVPWMEIFWRHFEKGGPSWRGLGAQWYEPVHSVYAFFVGTSCWTWWHKAVTLGLLGAGLLWVCWECWLRRVECFRSMRPRAWGWLLTLFLVPLGSVWIYSMLKINVFDERYLGLSALCVYICLGTFVACVPVVKQWFILGIILLSFAVPVGNQLFVYGYYDNWRLAAQWVKTSAQAGDAVAIYPAWNETPLQYYLRQQFPILGIPGRYDPISGVTADYFQIDPENLEQLAGRFAGYQRVGLILVNEGLEQNMIRDWFQLRFTQVSEQHSGGIHLYELRRQVP